jgi:hypothetical protein
MSTRIVLITVILLFPIPRGLAGFSESYKAYELGGYATTAREFQPLRSDLERAVESCTQLVHRDDSDFDVFLGSSVTLLGTPESLFKFKKCMSGKGFPLEKKAVVPAVSPTNTP